jgi:nucleoside-diphosphate-sugar epimerase
MNIFMTGATGYIGGTVAMRLVDDGHRVRGLVRSAEAADQLKKVGIDPVVGTLDDLALLAREARTGDGVIHTANADHAPSVGAFIDALAGTGKVLLHTSGSSVIGDDARGNRVSQSRYDENSPFVVEPAKQPRREIELAVLRAAERGVRSAVICPSCIYGVGRGVHPSSVQIPFLVNNAREQGVVQIIGLGLNRWSNVHIDDLAELYALALVKTPPGAFYFAENGEASFGEVGDAIATRLRLGPVRGLPAEEAAKKWGEKMAFYSLGSNSRVRALRARAELGWTPRHSSVTSWILSEMPM